MKMVLNVPLELKLEKKQHFHAVPLSWCYAEKSGMICTHDDIMSQTYMGTCVGQYGLRGPIWM